MANEWLKRRRKRLWEADPCCYWCRRPTILLNVPGGQLPENAATIDHLRSKFDPTRGQPIRGRWDFRYVLACWKCNNERARIEEKFLPKAELWRRSNHYPLWSRQTPAEFETLEVT